MKGKKIFIKIIRYEKIEDNWSLLGSYIQPVDKIDSAIDAEIDPICDNWKLELVPVSMTQEEYDKLPDFAGY